MSITAKEVNELRQLTGSGMMDCKKALVEANGDIQAAIDYLRKKGAKVAELRAGRESNEGAVIALTSADGKEGVVVRITCETDFVAKNEAFVAFTRSIAEHALAHKFDSSEALLASTLEGSTVHELILGKVSSIGEMITLGTYARMTGEDIVAYIHGNNRMGVLVALNQAKSEKIDAIGKDVAMQIAAMNPVAIDENSVSTEVVEREKAIIVEQMKLDPKMEGKSDEMLGKIADGKMGAFFKENTLLNQAFVKDTSKSVGQVLKETSAGLTVTEFRRVTLGSN